MSGKLILGMLIVLGLVFAAPNVYWSNPTPENATDYYGDATIFNMSSNESMGPNSFINIDGTNYTCTISADNLSCSYTLNITEKIYANTYDLIGYANITTYAETNESRTFDYHGCGQIGGTQTLEYNVGSVGYADDDCFQISEDSTSIDCAGYSITLSNESKMSIISAINKSGNTIENCILESGYVGVYFVAVTNSSINNNTFDNQTWDGIKMGNTSNINISFNNFWMDSVGHPIYGIDFISQGNRTIIFANNLTNGLSGISLDGNDNKIINNTIVNMSEFGIYMESLTMNDNNQLAGNDISGSNVGLFIQDNNQTFVVMDHLYNNSNDFVTLNALDEDLSSLVVLELDRPQGNHTNNTIVIIYDTIIPSSSYAVRWANVSVTPSGRMSFLGKFIEVEFSLMVPNESIIDNLDFTWLNSESAGYDEAQLELWGITYAGTAVLLNASPNTALNQITVANLNTTTYRNVGLYYHGSTVPLVPGNVSDDKAMTIVSQFTTVAIAFFLLFTIFGVFRLDKMFDFNGLFIPLMVAVLLVILAMGLFI